MAQKANTFPRKHTLLRLPLTLVWLLSVCGCVGQSDDQVIVFSALDREFSQAQFDRFAAATGTQVLPKFDTESTKTVGLVNQILQTTDRPICDVFWNNEILHTLRLQRAGRLQAVEIPAAENFPAAFRSPQNDWYGFAARARVLIINTDLLPDPAQYPQTISALVEPRWKGRACIAKPLFGTTATHFAVLYQQWGRDRFASFVHLLRDNQVAVLSGNRQVAADVASGKFAFGLTDTDDFNVERLAGRPVAIIFPDQNSKPFDPVASRAAAGTSPSPPVLTSDFSVDGSLLIPNTIAMIKGSRHRSQATALIAFALSGEVETALASGPSAQIPLNPAVSVRSPLVTLATTDQTPANNTAANDAPAANDPSDHSASDHANAVRSPSEPEIRWMQVPWSDTVDAWDAAGPLLQAAFL